MYVYVPLRLSTAHPHLSDNLLFARERLRTLQFARSKRARGPRHARRQENSEKSMHGIGIASCTPHQLAPAGPPPIAKLQPMPASPCPSCGVPVRQEHADEHSVRDHAHHYLLTIAALPPPWCAVLISGTPPVSAPSDRSIASASGRD